jgi:hypothetical protein
VAGLGGALGVAAGALTGDAPLPDAGAGPVPEPEESQMKFRLNEVTRNDFWPLAKRYGMPIARMVEPAPLLFVQAAEASLARRRSKLAELEALRARRAKPGSALPHLPYCIAEHFVRHDAIVAEKRSIAARNILADDLPDDIFRCHGPVAAEQSPTGEYCRAAHNPFVRHLTESGI